ncbi:MAG: cytidine deaminase [Candidatus Cloacimonetes bacterium]|jgi:cytidine deaminase|nr:cytidine deaminase [Candidatus Cloacimonadota bacterium]MDD4156287.1 cytidine deaminase [Candidatus Cloacimonadota bacterium]
MNKQLNDLLEIAKKASNNAYAPYSLFKIGAALLTESGEIFTGCNIENASFSLTICAERVAIFKAISNNNLKFSALAIYVQSDKAFPPCGACRQVINEFSKDLNIIYGNNKQTIITNINKLLPDSFSL